MKTNVVLIRPGMENPSGVDRDGIHNRLWPPLSLARCGTRLRAGGIGTKILDAHALGLTAPEAAAAARGADLALVTSSPLDRWECPNLSLEPVVSLVEALQAQGLRVGVCGVHGTVLPREVIEKTGADFLVLGEPEARIAAVAETLGEKEAPGIYRRGDPLPFLSFSPSDIGRLPAPAWDLLPPLKRYRHVVLGGPLAVIEGSRGCSRDCSVCLRAMYGAGFRPRTGEAIYGEAETAVKVAGARVLAFIDLDFCLNLHGAAEFCEKVLRHGLKVRWCCTTHVDSVDRDLLELMGRAGCRLVHYGLESASRRVLGLLGRTPPDGKERQALAWTRKAGMLSLGFFMFGAYDENPEEREDTLRLALSLPLDLASFHICNPLPGTGAERYLAPDRSDLFPRVFPEQDEEELDRFCRRAWKAFYVRPRRWGAAAGLVAGAGLAPLRLVGSLLARRRG